MTKKIIINADDFGLCEGVNKGVVKTHTEGVLTSATIMVNMPAATEAVEIARQLPTLGVGIHLNLTEGSPVVKDNSTKILTSSNGRFAYSPSQLFFLSMTRSKARNAIRTEIMAQIQWAIDKGLKPTHLDSHKHIHCLPTIFPIVCEAAKYYGIPAIRWPFEKIRFHQKLWPSPAKGGIKRSYTIRTLAWINRLQDSRFFKTGAFFGIAHAGKIDDSFFEAVCLHNRADTAEIMTHPGFIEGLDVSKTRLVQQRQVELQALCSERTRLYFQKANVQLVHYGQL